MKNRFWMNQLCRKAVKKEAEEEDDEEEEEEEEKEESFLCTIPHTG